MKINNEKYFAQMRNRRLPARKFRENAHMLSFFLAKKTSAKIPRQKKGKVVLIAILRSSIAMLPAFLAYFPDAPVGFIGLKRDEKTAVAKKYYENLPQIDKNSIIIIPDPMLATGGSLNRAVKMLLKKGILAENIFFTGFVGAVTGLDRISKIIPRENMTLLAIDPKLDKKKFIVPGLGDFGDRYFKS